MTIPSTRLSSCSLRLTALSWALRSTTAAPTASSAPSWTESSFTRNELFAFKPAAAVVSCRRGGASAAFDRLNKYFTISRMPVVSSQYWNSVHGWKPEDVMQDREGLQTMRALGDILIRISQ